MSAAKPIRRDRTHSFLVRVWREPREAGIEPEPIRVLVRDLRTGDERYLADPGQLSALLEGTADSLEEREEAGAAG